jgi:hypothetical protein
MGRGVQSISPQRPWTTNRIASKTRLLSIEPRKQIESGSDGHPELIHAIGGLALFMIIIANRPREAALLAYPLVSLKLETARYCQFPYTAFFSAAALSSEMGSNRLDLED